MIKRLFSKRSGFTLVEIIVAFAVFAIMAAMIVQILDLVSWQRRSNTEYANGLDEQEQYLVTHDKKPYDKENTGNDKELALNFGDENFKFNYQMYGANDSGDPNGLSYYVSKEGERDKNPGGGDSGGDDVEQNNDTGAQSDRMKVRLSGSRDFDYISVNKVEKIATDSKGNATYSFDLSASAENMRVDDVPNAMYRLYFYKGGNKSTEKAKILSAVYTGTNKQIATNWSDSSPDATGNPFVVVKSGSNGIVVSSPFKRGDSNFNPVTIKYKCSLCDEKFPNQWSGYSKCKSEKNTAGKNCHDYLTTYAEMTGEEYKGNGIRFTSTQHTKIEITFEGDPQLTKESFGDKGTYSVQPDGSCQYAGGKLSDGTLTGGNIYGAFSK